MRSSLMVVGLLIIAPACRGQEDLPVRGALLYESSLATEKSMEGWVMEGPGIQDHREGWLELYAPDEKWHHVLWCPKDFPPSFIAEWDVQNLNTKAGLLIVFFAATGINGEDIFDRRLPVRDGTFRNYTKEKIKGYHVSYYANNPKNPEREFAHLRKNNSFALVQTGPEGIPKGSGEIHRIRLVKDDDQINFYIDDRKIIDWKDNGVTYGPVYGGGKIGFRQMQWSHFRYRNFRVWSIK